MAKFTVYYRATASFSVEVEGDFDHLGGGDFEDAIRAAADQQLNLTGPPRLCAYCSGGMDLGDFGHDYDEFEGIYRHR